MPKNSELGHYKQLKLIGVRSRKISCLWVVNSCKSLKVRWLKGAKNFPFIFFFHMAAIKLRKQFNLKIFILYWGLLCKSSDSALQFKSRHYCEIPGTGEIHKRCRVCGTVVQTHQWYPMSYYTVVFKSISTDLWFWDALAVTSSNLLSLVFSSNACYQCIERIAVGIFFCYKYQKMNSSTFSFSLPQDWSYLS